MPPPPSATPPSAPADRGDDDLNDILAQLADEPASALDEAGAAASQIAAPSESVTRSEPGVGARLTDPRDLERPSAASTIVVESEGGINFDPSFASFGKRAVELIVDTIVLGLAMLPGLVIAAMAGSLWFVGLFVALIGFVLFVVLAARSIAADGQWLGNRVAGTRIVDGITGANIDVGRAGLRVAVRHLISSVLFLGFLIAFTDGQRRTFHDRLAHRRDRPPT